MTLHRAITRISVLLAGTALAVGWSAAAFAQDTLRVGTVRLPAAQGNPYQGTGPSDLYTLLTFFDSMFVIDNKGEATPGLANAWEVKDKNTWQFKLRPGVTFHNGAPWNAAAMVQAIDYLLTEGGQKNRVVREARNISGAKALDAMTVEVTTKSPNPILYREMAWLVVPEPKAFAEMGDAEFAKQPVGSGPYRVTSWVKGQVSGTAFAPSWRAAKTKAISIVELPEKVARSQALQSGQVDVATHLGIDDKEAVERAGAKLVVGAPEAVYGLRLNTAADSPVRDIRVRQALNYAVDKSGYIARLIDGRTVPAGQPIDQLSFGYNPNVKPYPFDPAKAKALLAEAGHPNGVKLIAEVVGELAELRDVYAQMASDMKKSGIDLELQSITLSDLINKAMGRTPWNGVMATISYSGGVQRDAMRPINSFGNSCGPMPYYCDEGATPLIQAANAEFDEAKRRAVVQQIMQRYHDQAAAIYMHEQVSLFGVGKNLHNFATVSGVPQWQQMTVGK